jgi:lysophospholipase L1-like esterase
MKRLRALLALAIISVTPTICSAAPLNILCYGDSITTGITHVQGQPFYHPGGYRQALADALARRGLSCQFVGSQATNPPHNHAGYPGFAWASVFNAQGTRIRWGIYDTTENAPADIMILWAGHNHLAVMEQDRDWNGLQTLQARARTMVQKVLATRPNARVVLVGLTPLKTPDARTPFINAWNADLSRFCKVLQAEGLPAWPSHVEVGFDPVLHVQDALHPNGPGYEHIGNRLSGTIWAVLLQPVPLTWRRLLSSSTK